MELNIGQKIKAMRLASDLTQAELADRADLTKGFISQLENEQSSISVDALADILDALGISLTDFFSDQSEPQVVFSPEDRIAVEGKGVSLFELLVPGSTNNDMDPIMVEMAPGEALERTDPHPGEQFGYVMSGTATLIIDKKRHRIPARHCFYFTSDRVHQISNEGNAMVKLLWLTTPPQM